MNVLFLGLLFVLVFPCIGGVLFALLLREVHVHHPLPLGGAIVFGKKRSEPEPVAESHEDAAEVDESAAESATVENQTVLSGEQDELPPDLTALLQPSASPAGPSVFDDAGAVPKDLPVGQTLNAMTSESSVVIPAEMEKRIEESAQSDTSNAASSPFDMLHPDDLHELDKALQRQNIDFSQEEAEISTPDGIAPAAKEALGENFDFAALEEQAKKTSQSLAEAIKEEKAPEGSPEYSPDAQEIDTQSIDIQEDETGTIQVSSTSFSTSFLDIAVQLAEDTEAQTILPAFSSDWIQNVDSASALGDISSFEGNVEDLCFSADTPPMFSKKGKQQGKTTGQSNEKQ